MDSLYIIVPAYNEEENVKSLVENWYPIIEKFNGDGKSRLVIIDDGSKDSTLEILTTLQKNHPYLEALTKQNSGHGPTLIYGYKYAIKQGADFIFQTDSDGQTNPAEFENFWNQRNEYDAILGNRTDRKDGQSRVFVEKVLLLLLRIFFGVKMPDSNAPFRLMKHDLVSKYVKKLPEFYNLPNVMLSTYFVFFKEKIKFEEISFAPRQGGINSINKKKIIKIGWNALFDFVKLRLNINRVD